ncbi:MAG: glycoside hydrolase family 125 protein, partial [Bacilli bacterium]
MQNAQKIRKKPMKNFIIMPFIILFSIVFASCDDIETSTSHSDDSALNSDSSSSSDSTISPDEYLIANGGFETGDLSGWDILSGEAFSPQGLSDLTMVNNDVSYGKEGDYFFKGVEIEGRDGYEGQMRSEAFLVGGSGYITFYLGGGLNPGLTYLSIINAESGREIRRFANSLFNNPSQSGSGEYYVENLVPYYADLGAFMGLSFYILLVDQSTDNVGYLSSDGIVTYYPETPSFEGMYPAIDIHPVFNETAQLPYEIPNQDFASGDLTSWTVIGEEGVFKDSHINLNHRLSNRPDETKVGVLRSSAFRVGGTNLLQFRLGATKYRQVTYLSIKRVATNEEVFRAFSDRWKPENEENTHLYYVDLGAYLNEGLYLEFVDNSRGDWGLLSIEAIDSHLTDLPDVKDEIAYNILLPNNTSPSYAEMREILNPYLAGISNETIRTTYEKNFYATIDGISNNKGNWPSVLHFNANGTTYVTTGDINAMWLRDSSAQVLPYLRFLNDDSEIKMMVRGLLLKQFEFIRRDPYANAFYNDGSIHERKFEIDSLIYPFWLADKYYAITHDGSIFDAFFIMSLRKALATLNSERNHSDENYQVTNQNDLNNSSPNFNPDSGLIWSGYRPSDDVTYYKFFIPGNMFAVSIMDKMSGLLVTLGKESTLASELSTFAMQVRAAIETYGVYNHPTYGKIY